MRTLILRWIGLAVCLAVMAWAFVNLGFWQLNRLTERRENNQTVQAQENSPIREFAEVFGRPISDADAWQRVTVRGTFDAQHQFVVRYRSNAGATGYEIVTPLRTDQGSVLVSRGFVQRPSGQDFPKVAPPPPAGSVTVLGYVRRNEVGDADAVTPTDGQVRVINTPALAVTLPYPVVDGYLSLITVTPPQSADFVPVAPPELTEGNHFSYALQWFAFAVLAGIGLVVFIRADLRDRRRARARAAKLAATTPQQAEHAARTRDIRTVPTD